MNPDRYKNLVRFLCSQGAVTTEHAIEAARSGRLSILQSLYEECNVKLDERVCEAAALGRHLPALVWLREVETTGLLGTDVHRSSPTLPSIQNFHSDRLDQTRKNRNTMIQSCSSGSRDANRIWALVLIRRFDLGRLHYSSTPLAAGRY